MAIKYIYFWNSKRHGRPENWTEAVSLMQSLVTQQDLSDEINENYDDSVDTIFSLSSGFDYIWEEFYTEGVVEELDRLRDIFQAQGLNALYKLPIEKPDIAANIEILLMGTVENYSKDIVMFSEHFNLFLMSGGRILTSSDIYDEDGHLITTLKAYMEYRKNPYKLTSAKALQSFLDKYAEKMAGMGFFHKGVKQYDENAVISFLKKADFGHIDITIKASKDDNVIQLQGFINAITPYLSTMLDTYMPETYPLIEIDYIRFEDKVFGYAKNSEQANKLYQMIDHQVSQINYPTNYAELMYFALNTNSYLELPTLLLAYQCNSPDFTWLMALLHRKIKSIDESNERKSQTNPNHQYFNGLKERYEELSKLLEQYPEQAVNGKSGTDNPNSDFQSLNVDGFAKKSLPMLAQILLQQGFSQTNTSTEPYFTRQTEYGEQILNLRVGGGQGAFIISGDISLIVSKLYPYYDQLELPYQVSKPLLDLLIVTISSSKLPYTVSSKHELNHFYEQFQTYVIEKLNMLQTFTQLDYFIDDGQPLVHDRGWWLKNKFQQFFLLNGFIVDIDIASQLLIAKLAKNRDSDEYAERIKKYRKDYLTKKNISKEFVDELVKRVNNMESGCSKAQQINRIN